MKNHSCFLCRAIERQETLDIIYEDEHVICFMDPYPATKAHAVVAPKKHIENMLKISNDDSEYVIKIHQGIQKAAKHLNIEETGFRIIVNNGPDAEQELFHLHYHVIGGRKLKWEL